MSKKTLSKRISDYLNSGAVDIDPLSGDEVEVLGFKMTYREESEMHSSDVSAYLSGENILIQRDGVKEVSYGNWVGTDWIGEWRPINE